MLYKIKAKIKATKFGELFLLIKKGGRILLASLYDSLRYVKYSNTLNFDKSEQKAIATIILTYHIIEKGLTMREMKLGFGKDRVLILCRRCNSYLKQYGNSSIHLRHAVGVLSEYIKVHNNLDFKLDDIIYENVQHLEKEMVNIPDCKQRILTAENISTLNNLNFLNFSRSRSSLRNYSEEVIPDQLISEVIDLARNVPSSCNRQPSRVHFFNDKRRIERILTLQNGNRGFGEYSCNLIILTTDLSGYGTVKERNMHWIDGGIFLMNLVYALQYYKIGSCILNWGVEPKVDKKMYDIAELPVNESIICILTLGFYPENTVVPISLKRDIDEILVKH